MPTEKILYSDDLRQGTDKLNKAIDQANKAESDSLEAKSKAENALGLSNDVQTQLNTIVINGDSSVEAAQARVSTDDEGDTTTYTTLKERLDEEHNKVVEKILASEKAANERGINIMFPPPPLVGAKGDYDPTTGMGTDDTTAIQAIIDYANNNGIRKVFAPGRKYLISNSLILNGCTLIGNTVNIYNTNKVGTVFYTKTNNFIAIKQGSTSVNDIEFNLSDIFVVGAQIGFEINYAINSKFERLFAQDCDTGYKFGDITSVGSMFCEFNNLYTVNTRIGAIIQTKEHFNNNRFNNGFIYGTEKAFHLEVIGGFGAVNNVFNNVEFRSPLGRGIVLKNVKNTIFNNPYFECGGNAIRTLDFCDIYLKEPIFALFRAVNTNSDKSLIFAEGGFRMNVNGGTIFLSSENNNTSLYDAIDSSTLLNITKTAPIKQEGTATNFVEFKGRIKEIGYKQEKQAVTTATLTVEPNTTQTVDFTFPTPFSKSPDYYSVVMRGSSGQESNVQFLLVTITATGGQISVRNNSSGVRSLAFRVSAELLN